MNFFIGILYSIYIEMWEMLKLAIDKSLVGFILCSKDPGYIKMSARHTRDMKDDVSHFILASMMGPP